MDYKFLTAENAYIWRIVRRNDVAWLIKNGLHCGNNIPPDNNYKTMGNEELIAKRNTKTVPIGNGGLLNDYVPFYFTPFSPMMYNIHTGYNGISKVHNEDVVILVASLNDLKKKAVDFVFTDMHAYMMYANFYSDLEHLDKIDWDILQKCDFKREKMERYQAEALIYQHLPIQQLRAIICYSETVKSEIESYLKQHNLVMRVDVAQYMYFK
jgi:hypothetical protein